MRIKCYIGYDGRISPANKEGFGKDQEELNDLLVKYLELGGRYVGEKFTMVGFYDIEFEVCEEELPPSKQKHVFLQIKEIIPRYYHS